MKHRIHVLAVLVAAGAPCLLRAAQPVHAIWVTRFDFKTPHDVRALVSNCASLGLNRIYLQVRGQADARYRSSLEPRAELPGPRLPVPADFDPLALAVSECRSAGIQLVAWVNVLPGWKGDDPPADRSHVFHRHPDWFMVDRKGRRRMLGGNEYALLNPCLPEVREHLSKVVSEIASNYPVHGVQFDYIRFQDRSIRRGEDVPYDRATLARFHEQTGVFPIRAPERWDAFRRLAMDKLVRVMSESIRRARPGAIVSVAAWPDFEHARNHLFQDVTSWRRREWIDEVCPMTYENSRWRFHSKLGAILDELPAADLVPGIGLYTIENPRDAGGQIELARKSGVRSFALFAYTSLFLSRNPESSKTPRAAAKRARMRREVAGGTGRVLETAAGR